MQVHRMWYPPQLVHTPMTEPWFLNSQTTPSFAPNLDFCCHTRYPFSSSPIEDSCRKAGKSPSWNLEEGIPPSVTFGTPGFHSRHVEIFENQGGVSV